MSKTRRNRDRFPEKEGKLGARPSDDTEISSWEDEESDEDEEEEDDWEPEWPEDDDDELRAGDWGRDLTLDR